MMEMYDVVLLSRIQFASVIAYHFIFVPLTIGVGLILAINETHYYHTRDPRDAAASRFWVKVYTATFAIGVATGLTMEFSFGTNWANYSRFVGDVFGPPLAAEGLFAFFLESIFLGFLLFGRNRVSPGFYMASAWLVWIGSLLSALWILIANSWMQTPAGSVLSPDGSEAIIIDFWEAAFNPTILPTYTHTVLALLVMGSFASMAMGAWYMWKGTHEHYALSAIRLGSVVGIVTTCLLLVSAHLAALEIWHEQPTKLAMMEGQYNTVVPDFSFGFVDEQNEEVIPFFEVPGATSFLATGTWDTEYPGLNELSEVHPYDEIDVDEMPVNFVYIVYHLMVFLFFVIFFIVMLGLITSYRHGGRWVKEHRWIQWFLILGPLAPFLAIQCGWCTAEVGRQPWVVYPAVSAPEGVSLLTEDAVSVSVSSIELIITLSLFFAVYMLLLVGWVRVQGKFIAEGPVIQGAEAKLHPKFKPQAVPEERIVEAHAFEHEDTESVTLESKGNVEPAEPEAKPKKTRHHRERW